MMAVTPWTVAEVDCGGGGGLGGSGGLGGGLGGSGGVGRRRALREGAVVGPNGKSAAEAAVIQVAERESRSERGEASVFLPKVLHTPPAPPPNVPYPQSTLFDTQLLPPPPPQPK